jgi:hypothetical protein
MDWRVKHAVNPWNFLGINPQQIQLGNADRAQRMFEMEPHPFDLLKPRSGFGVSQQAHPYQDTETKKQQASRELTVPAHYYSQTNRE